MDDLQVGDKLQDNDPRMRKRVLEIVEILPNGVAAKNQAGKVRKYLRRRIFTDNKERRYGFNKLYFLRV